MLCQHAVMDETELTASTFALESTALFGAMNPDQVNTLWSLLKGRDFGCGELIFRQDELPTNIYVVVSGEVELIVNGRVVDTFSSGDAFGVASLIGIQTQVGSARVSSNKGASVLVLDRDALMFLQSNHLEVFSLLVMNAARHVSRRLHLELSSCEA